MRIFVSATFLSSLIDIYVMLGNFMRIFVSATFLSSFVDIYVLLGNFMRIFVSATCLSSLIDSGWSVNPVTSWSLTGKKYSFVDHFFCISWKKEA